MTFVIEGGPRTPARVGGNYGQAGGMAFGESFRRSGFGKKFGEGRAGAWGPAFITKGRLWGKVGENRTPIHYGYT